MEQHLLLLDPQVPDTEQMNAIFRAAHSIKGGAGTFGFTVLQETTHLMENLLDGARRGEMRLSTDIINLFLERKDIMQDQLDAYKTAQEPNAESFEYICHALRQLALDAKGEGSAQAAAAPTLAQAGNGELRISLTGLKTQEIPQLLEELGNLGTVKDPQQTDSSLDVTLVTSESEDDISAVLCFVLELEQIHFGAPLASTPSAAPVAEPTPELAVAPIAPEPVVEAKVEAPSAPVAAAKAQKPALDANKNRPKTGDTSIRVAVEKVDQLINLVGELVITQSMLAQRSTALDPVAHADLLNSMG